MILVIGPTEPGTRATYSATWLGRRLGAEVLVVEVVEYLPPRDELVDARVASARRVVSATAARLAHQGVVARSLVVVAKNREGGATVDDLAQQHETELVAVTSRRRSWFWVAPGSAVARHLTRAGRTPVLVIPDHRAGPWTRFLTGLRGSRGVNARLSRGGR